MTYVSEASVIATSVIFIVLGILTVGLRFKVRRDRKLSLGPDDWLILGGLVWHLVLDLGAMRAEPDIELFS